MGDTPDFQYGKGNLDHFSQVLARTPGKNNRLRKKIGVFAIDLQKGWRDVKNSLAEIDGTI